MKARFRTWVQDAAADLVAVENRLTVLSVLGSRLLKTIQVEDRSQENLLRSTDQTMPEYAHYPFDKLITDLQRFPDRDTKIIAALIGFYELGRLTFEIEAAAQSVADRFESQSSSERSN